MEDISRELEREIAKSRPKPFRKNNKIKILMVDDFGRVISGNHMKIIFVGFCFISVAAFFTSILFIYKYVTLSGETAPYKERLVLAEKKIIELTTEKEVLMARLVILGKEPGLKKNIEKAEKSIKNDFEEKPPVISKLPDTKLTASDSLDNEEPSTSSLDPVNPGSEAEAAQGAADSKSMNRTVLIEKFAVIRNRAGKDLLVRFDIRNISKGQGDVSGRIFTILRPDNNSEDQWLVVPTAALTSGIPSEHQKGQYFSIAHFKPVKFRIKSEVDPDFYKKASIFIFNGEGELIFEKLIDITEAG
nr:hypothetical protein [Desulfobacula sp.]